MARYTPSSRLGLLDANTVEARVSDGGAALWVLVADLKHDLGKYVAWRSANYSDDAWEGPLQAELVDALQSDILRTLGGRSAWEIWTRHTEAFPRPWAHEALAEVEAAVDVLRAHREILMSGCSDALASARPALRAAQVQIREALRRAARDLRPE